MVTNAYVNTSTSQHYNIISHHINSINLTTFCPGKGQNSPCVNAEHHDEQRLHRVDDEHKVERVDIAYAVEDEHCLNGKVPRTGTVRRRNDDSDAAHDERYESARHTKARRSLETEEREIVVEEVTRPDAQRERHEEPRVLHVAHSHGGLQRRTLLQPLLQKQPRHVAEGLCRRRYNAAPGNQAEKERHTKGSESTELIK
jgi:hypothetical protein